MQRRLNKFVRDISQPKDSLMISNRSKKRRELVIDKLKEQGKMRNFAREVHQMPNYLNQITEQVE